MCSEEECSQEGRGDALNALNDERSRMQARSGRSSEVGVEKPFKERRQERRIDPMLATLVDVAIAYHENLGWQVAQAFMRETGVPAALVQNVLTGAARQRSCVLRRWTPRAVAEPFVDGRPGEGPA